MVVESNNHNTKLQKLEDMRNQSRLGGGEKRIASQHERGKLTARERIDLLMDEGTFQELDAFVTHRSTDFGLGDQITLGDAVVTGYGQVNGRQIFVYAQDFTIIGGTLSEVAAGKICKVMDIAMKVGSPVVGIQDSGGARIQEGVLSLAGYGDIFLRNSLSSGVIPQISVIMGPCAGGASYSPALTDFIFMVQETSQMFITGPDVIRSVTGEEVTAEQLGGADAHNTRSGVAHFMYANDKDCLSQVRRLLDYLPSNNAEDPPVFDFDDDISNLNESLRTVVPDSANQAYNMKDVILKVVDDGEFMETHEFFAPNMIVGFARISGKSVGIVANQPAYMAGAIDIDASDKASRFVRICDSFNIPIITFVDTPGFMPGTQQEYGGIIRHGAKIIYAYSEATVPKITILTRKAYGGAYIVMGSKHLGTDINYSWPSGEIAVMGPEGAVNIIHRKRIQDADNPEDERKKLMQEYSDTLANPYVSSSRGYLDDVIDPATTRKMLAQSLEMLKDKRDTLPPKKHGNIPL
jgi:propionyl-CoA carboxylase beta chain